MTVTPKKSKPVYVGLSITMQAVEIAVFNPKTNAIEKALSQPVPPGLFDPEGDVVHEPVLLKEMIAQIFRELKPKPVMVHLSIPGSLLRIMDMPKIGAGDHYVSLSSEAERYKTFDNTEAVVDYVPIEIPGPPPPPGQPPVQHLVCGAVRSDTLNLYLRIMKELRVKVASVSLKPMNVLRAMAGTGVLDSLVHQIGPEAYWGAVFVEPTRVRLSLWQANRLVELRETTMETGEFAMAGPDSIVVEDILEEIRRTTKNVQPSIWLANDMPPNMEQILSARLGCPVRTTPLGDGIFMPAPLQLATVGTALISKVDFPFDFDLLVGLRKIGGGGGGAGTSAASDAADSAEGVSNSADWMLPAGVVSILIGLVATGGLMAASAMAEGQKNQLEPKRDEAKLAVDNLLAKEAELKKKAELDQTLLKRVTDARIRNKVYLAMTEDLRQKTPEKVWIYSMDIGSDFALNGKALSHQSVINFARSFDQSSYTKAVEIQSIKESLLNGSLVYDFKIGGNVFLDPSLVAPQDSAATKTIQAPNAPGVKEKPEG